jgi:hypothetical protein
VGDVIVRLNGVYLPGVEGGVQGWVALFQSYSKVERDVVIRRQVPAVTAATVPATASLARAPTTNNNTMLPSSGGPSAPAAPQQNTVMAYQHTATATVRQQQQSSTLVRETVTVFKPTKDSKLGIGLVGAAGSIKVISIVKGGLFSTTSLQVGMTIPYKVLIVVQTSLTN